MAWMTAGGLCLLAAVMCLSIPSLRRTSGGALEDVGQETPQI